MYPGDPNGSAGNVINCRCTMIAGLKNSWQIAFNVLYKG
jgi:hypothetical protein